MRADHARDWEVATLAAELLRDERWWRAGGAAGVQVGGVTLSGGEPLLQAQGAGELLDCLGGHGTHRVVETAGAAPRQAFETLLPRVELWLYDLKSVDDKVFRAGTGGEAITPMNNLAWLLDETAAEVRVRLPVIHGFNNDDTQLQRMADWLSRRRRRPIVEPLAGHMVNKPGAARETWPVASPQVDASMMNHVRQLLAHAGLEIL